MKRANRKRAPRAPRTPMNVNLLIVEEAEERTILAAMRPWPRQMEARLKAAGYDNFADGDAVLQAMFERKLADPRVPDALASVKWLAEQGHRSAQAALRNYATAMLEDSAANPPASLRSYLINILNDRVALHPPDHQNDIIRNMLRDIAIAMMAAEAADRWVQLPKLNSGRRHSIAWLIAEAMTDHGRDYELTERQVRRILQDYRRGIGERLSKFLLAGAVE
jgi:hypothetical protein